MNTKKTQSQDQQLRADLQELTERITHALPKDGSLEPQPGVIYMRNSKPGEPVHGVIEPSLCVIAQGSKVCMVGDDVFRYAPAQYLISTMNLPLVGEVTEASEKTPYLSFRLALDPAIVTSVMVESGKIEPGPEGKVKAVDVSPMDVNLLDATLRLVRLTETPDDYRILSPLVIREIIYRLLSGAQGNRLRHLATLGGQSPRMARAVETLRDNFDKPLRIESVARDLGMSVSGFHAHFKAVTAMSPLQFQKQLRLQEARRLMLNEALDAAEAGFKVGYDDASHFSREYKRQFGEPPMRDIERLRQLA